MGLSSRTNLVTGMAGSNPHRTPALTPLYRLDHMHVVAITIQMWNVAWQQHASVHH